MSPSVTSHKKRKASDMLNKSKEEPIPKIRKNESQIRK